MIQFQGGIALFYLVCKVLVACNILVFQVFWICLFRIILIFLNLSDRGRPDGGLLGRGYKDGLIDLALTSIFSGGPCSFSISAALGCGPLRAVASAWRSATERVGGSILASSSIFADSAFPGSD